MKHISKLINDLYTKVRPLPLSQPEPTSGQNLIDDEQSVVRNRATTKTKCKKLQHSWVIDNYSDHERKESIAGPDFSDEESGTTWKLIACPNHAYSDLVLALILIKSKSATVLCNYRFSLGKGLSKKIYNNSKKCTKKQGDLLVTPKKFLTKGSLIKKGIIVNDRLEIICEVTIFNTVTELLELKLPSTEKVPPCDLKDNLLKLFENEKFSDVTLCANGQEFKVHKNILSTRSPIFCAMFSHDMKENKDNRVDLIDIEPDVLKEMLIFIYSGKTSLKKMNDTEDEENKQHLAAELLKASDKYQLDRLKIICEKTLSNMLTVDSAAEMLGLSDMYKASSLKDCALAIINSCADEIIETDGWKRVAKENPSVLAEAFKSFVRGYPKMS